jgi:hypothetical protein
MGAAACGDGSSGNSSPPPASARTDRYAIERVNDCHQVRDYPYARNLFCPAAFSAVETMVSAVADSIGAERPSGGFFYYYQTRADEQASPDDPSQTTAGCLHTEAPWGSTRVRGAGTPLCHLVAYVTSPGPLHATSSRKGNPVPEELRAFPRYFARLYPPDSESLLEEFRLGSAFDAIVPTLGARATNGFLLDYPSFSPDELYDPRNWLRDSLYHGISGGGGGGWGGEIALARPDEDPQVLLAFGGGGGGGMTSMRSFGVTSSRVGAGGGGGMQLADGYRSGDRSYNGLGLGAGVGSDDDEIQFSYFDYVGSGRTPQPVHEYNPPVIADYEEQLSNLVDQLDAALSAGATVVVRGGGGMGGGAEYLMENGEEFAPHALSTQAGFQFRYEFRRAAGTVRGRALDREQEDAYAKLGEFYRRANAEAFAQCGRDYSNYACICPKAHATVICLMAQELGDPTKIPAWLQEQHCPNDPDSPNQLVNRLTSYQRLLLESVTAPPADQITSAPQPFCSNVLLEYFENLNAPETAG